VGFC